MENSSFRATLVMCTSMAMLTGCGNSDVPIAARQSNASLRAVLSRTAARAARPACARPRRDEAECLALILDRTAQPQAAGWGPADFQARYKLPSGTKGSGQIVAIVDAYDNPNVASDLKAYRSNFGLGTAPFTKYNQRGQTQNYPAANAGWGVEIDLDAEMVSATCPKCTIDLIEADSSNAGDLQTAESEAVALGAHIVNNSWGCDGADCVDKKHFDTKGVTYLGSAGDAGYGQVGAPAAFASVVAVGGTVLSKSGSQYGETIWSASGGGCATGIKKPHWQRGTPCGYRLANDAAAVAWNVAEYDTYGSSGWLTVGGTSVATPLLAGVFGLAGNAAKQDGGRTFWQSAHHKSLYAIAGQCAGYSHGQYTTCAGWGSPDGIAAF